MGCALDVVAVIVNNVAKYYIDKPKFSGLGKKRPHHEKKHCLNSDDEITQHAIEKDANSKTFTLSTVSYVVNTTLCI